MPHTSPDRSVEGNENERERTSRHPALSRDRLGRGIVRSGLHISASFPSAGHTTRFFLAVDLLLHRFFFACLFLPMAHVTWCPCLSLGDVRLPVAGIHFGWPLYKKLADAFRIEAPTGTAPSHVRIRYAGGRRRRPCRPKRQQMTAKKSKLQGAMDMLLRVDLKETYGDVKTFCLGGYYSSISSINYVN